MKDDELIAKMQVSLGWTLNKQAIARIEALTAEVERLNERLENNRVYDGKGNRIDVEAGSIPDGIDCRDETIRMLEARLAALQPQEKVG